MEKMTWEEFKAEVEKQGVVGTTEIVYIDWSAGFDTENPEVEFYPDRISVKIT